MGYEDVRLRGCDPPPRQRAGVGDSADAEQLAVVTFHHGDAITDEPNHERPGRRHFPVARREVGCVLAPQLDCDLAIGCTTITQIKGAEDQVQAGQAIGCERPTARQRSGLPAEQPAMKTQQAGDAGNEVAVEGDDGGERAAGRRVTQP